VAFNYATSLADLRATDTALFCQNSINSQLDKTTRGVLKDRIMQNAIKATELSGKVPHWLSRAFVNPESAIPTRRPALQCACLKDGVF